ncbi:MAG: hypothetical protein RRY97_02000 [Oscillibacter sp.]
MGMVFIGVGTATLGRCTKNAAGEIVSQTPASWEPNPAGGCVAIAPLDPEKMEPTGAAEIFGDWDAAGYLARVLEQIRPTKPVNVPDLSAIIKAATRDGVDVCKYCKGFNCSECIMNKWKGGNDDE